MKKRIGDVAVLGACIGKTVVSLSRDQYIFNGVPSGSDCGSLEVALADGTFVTLSTAADGESVRAAAGPLVVTPGFDMSATARADWQRLELTERLPWSCLLGQVLSAVDAVVDTWRDVADSTRVTGWVLRFATGDSLCYLNSGDESRILWNEMPEPYERIDRRLEPVARGA